MVQDYDIYYRKSPTSHTGYRITQSAVPGVVSHGVPDWLYEGNLVQEVVSECNLVFEACAVQI